MKLVEVTTANIDQISAEYRQSNERLKAYYIIRDWNDAIGKFYKEFCLPSVEWNGSEFTFNHVSWGLAIDADIFLTQCGRGKEFHRHGLIPILSNGLYHLFIYLREMDKNGHLLSAKWGIDEFLSEEQKAASLRSDDIFEAMGVARPKIAVQEKVEPMQTSSTTSTFILFLLLQIVLIVGAWMLMTYTYNPETKMLDFSIIRRSVQNLLYVNRQ